MGTNKKLLEILAVTAVFISVFVLTLLALNAFTISYLTPFAHFLKAILSPFVPLIMPFSIGATIKTCKHAPFPCRRSWLFQGFSLIFQQSRRVIGDLATLYQWSRLGNGQSFMGWGLEEEGVCGLNECMGGWVELALIMGVLVGEWMGWNWDAGFMQKWVDAVAEGESVRKEREARGEIEPEMQRIEKGEGHKEVKVVDEKATRE